MVYEYVIHHAMIVIMLNMIWTQIAASMWHKHIIHINGKHSVHTIVVIMQSVGWSKIS